MFRAQVERSAHRIALRSKKRGSWHGTTWGEWNLRAKDLAGGLLGLGVMPGDRVAIFADTREEWVVADMAILLAGGITVPVYPTLTSEQAAFTLSDSGAKIVFVGDREQLEKVRSAEAARILGTVERIVVFDADLATHGR